LHIHTPFTKLNNKYSTSSGIDIWVEFCKKIESSDVRVFGITDYFSVENYLTFIKKFRAEYPSSEKIFFPNIELRVDRSSNNRNEGYDLHLIFDNQIDDKQLEKFLENLKLDNTDESIRNLKVNELKTEAQFKAAFTTLPFINEALKDTFGNKKPYLKVLMAHGHGGVQPEKGNSRKHAVAEESDKRVANIYFGCDEKDRNYYLNDRGQVKKKKPCVTGSDSHSFEDFDNKVGKKFANDVAGQRYTLLTWIKADKTFEGLKQIIYEPSDRVFLGDKPDKLIEVESRRSRYIDSIKIRHTDSAQISGWFNDEIPLNPGLVAVIGRKGQGKSALTDIISFCGKTKIALDDYSFLRKDKFRKRGTAKDYSATLKWLDETQVTENLDLEVNTTEVEKIKYLPQKYVETICNDDGVSAKFQKEIDKVIFSYIPEEGRLNTTNLGDLVNVKTETIDTKISQIRADLNAINEKIVKLEGKKQPEYLESLKKKLVEKQRELKSLVKPKSVSPPKTKLKKSDQNKLDKLTKEIEKISKKIDSAKIDLKTTNDKINKLDKLKAAVEKLSESADKIIKDFAADAKFLLIDLSKLFSVKVSDGIFRCTEQKLSDKKKILEELLDQSDKPSPESLYAKKSNLGTQKESIIGALGEDQKRYSAYQEKLKEYKTQKKKIEGSKEDLALETIKSIESGIIYLKRKVNSDLKVAMVERVSLVEKLYAELRQKSDFYKDIYRPTAVQISQN